VLISEYLNTDIAGLRELANGSPAVKMSIASTCNHIRNLSIRRLASLFDSKKQFKIEFNNLCFGRGWKLAKGQVISMGACVNGWATRDNNMRFKQEGDLALAPSNDLALSNDSLAMSPGLDTLNSSPTTHDYYTLRPGVTEHITGLPVDD